MKMGYLRPKSMGIPGEEHREDSNVQDAAKREGGKAGKAGAGLSGMAGPAAVQDVPSLLEGSTKSRGAWVEVVHMPSGELCGWYVTAWQMVWFILFCGTRFVFPLDGVCFQRKLV